MSIFSTTNESLKWFKENFPRDDQLLDDILDRIGGILSYIKIRDGKVVKQPIQIVVANSPSDLSRLTISMDTYGEIFIEIMAKAILDSLTSEFEAPLSGNIANDILEKKIK